MKYKKVLVSTDIGSDIDDALSLLVMFNSGINVQGIYTTNAKDLRFRSYIARHMVNLTEKKITVGHGESNPLHNTIEPYSFFEDCFVDSSFEDEEASKVEREIQFKQLEEAGIVRNGLEDLANKLEKERYVIFSLAPLTNIAKLIQDYVNSARNIEQIYIMGGNLQGNLEHNIRYDPIAANIVFSSNIPITIIPQELCIKSKMPVHMLDQLKNSKVGVYVKNMARGFIAANIAKDSYSTLNEIKYDLTNIYFHKNYNKKFEMDRLLTNLDDPYFGAFEPDKYFDQYDNLIRILRDTEINYNKKEIAASILKLNIPKEISIADVYVPYCFLHPEKLKIKRGKLVVGDLSGNSKFIEGSEHDFVVDLDYNHFQEFVKQHLH